MVGANTAAPQIYGVSEARFDRHLKNGQAQQWNVFFEKSFRGNWIASAGYSASRSTNLPNRNYPFQTLQNVSSTTLSAWRDQYIASNGTLNPANQQVANPLQPASGSLLPFVGTLGGATMPRYVTQLPYLMLFGTGARVNDSNGYANYQSMQLRLGHAFSSGFQFDANYTWSKELDYTTTATEDGQGFNSGGSAGAPDILNLENNKKYGFSDIPHRFVGVLLYELPFGQGKMLAIRNPVARAIVGNWQIGSVFSFQAGMPFVLSGASDGASVGRPNRIPGVSLEVPKELQRWYNGTHQRHAALRPRHHTDQEHLPQVQRLCLRGTDRYDAEWLHRARPVLGGQFRTDGRRPAGTWPDQRRHEPPPHVQDPRNHQHGTRRRRPEPAELRTIQRQLQRRFGRHQPGEQHLEGPASGHGIE